MLSLLAVHLKESISDISNLMKEDDIFQPTFKAVCHLIRNVKDNIEENRIEQVLHCVAEIRDCGKDACSYKHRVTLIKAIILAYLSSLGNKPKSRKLEKVLEIVSSIWPVELVEILRDNIRDVLSQPQLTSEQLANVSCGLEESKLFREGIDQNIHLLLGHINNILLSISEHISTENNTSLNNPIKKGSPAEMSTASKISQDISPAENLSSTPGGPPIHSMDNPCGPPVHYMDLCYTCVKVCLQVFQYLPISSSILLWERETTPDCSLPSGIVNNLQFVLSKHYSKDCNLIAGSALAMLVNTVPNITEAMLLIKLLLWDHQEAVHIGNTEITRLPPHLKDGQYCKIAIIRGILTCCKPTLLLYTDENEDIIFLHSLFFDVVSICKCPNHAILYNAFQLLVYWYEGAIATLEQSPDDILLPERKTWFNCNSIFVKETLQLIWENWQNPLSGVSTFVKVTFDLLLEVHQKENKIFKKKSSSDLYNSLVTHLLKISWHVKGKYALLSSLVPYIGALHLLSSHPTLPNQLVRGLATNYLASAVSDLHKTLLQNMAKEVELLAKETNGEIVDAASKWKYFWEESVISVLCSDNNLIRYHGADYWLPWIFKCFPGTYDLLINSLNSNSSDCEISSNCRLHAVVMVMAQARQAGIINFAMIEKNVSVILRALYHVDDNIRLHAFALICNSPKKAEPLQQLELDMLQQFLPFNLICDGASFRQKMCANMKVVITRIRDSCLASLKLVNRKKLNVKYNVDKRIAEAENILFPGTEFIDWLLKELMQSLFPGACYQRKRAALGLLTILFDLMLSKGQSNKRKGKTPDSTILLIKWANERNKCNFICERYRSLLLECLLDGSNDIRDLAHRIVSLYFPWSLQGFQGAASTDSGVLSIGLQLISSPKSPECEAGAKLFMLIFQWYVLEGKEKSVSGLVGTFRSMKFQVLKTGPEGVLSYLQQLTEILVNQQKCCSKNILYGSLTTPMHGVLLTIRNCLTIDSSSVREIMLSDRNSWADWINSLIFIVSDIINLAMSALSGGIGRTELSPSFADIGEGIDDLVEKMQNCQIEGQEMLEITTKFDSEQDNPAMSAGHQLIMACCWLNLKEVSLLLGELSKFVPFALQREDGLITLNQINLMKEMFVNILTKCRHRGAIEGCNLGFSRLCSSLLSSPSRELSIIPKTLIEDVINLITNKGSTSSFTKKSAGLPLLIEAVINSEPRGREKRLLQFTMTSLLNIAQQPEPIEHDPRIDLPQCHALNMLKALFRSAAINDDVMPYTSKSVILAINGFASTHFSIRNGSMLLFGSLIARMFGQKRVQDERSCVNSMTALEFFVHYPELQSFLLQEISKCIDQQVSGNKSLHPSLFPVLIILSKLGCGFQIGEISVLEEFIQPLMLLCKNPVYQVRVLAAEALVPLVPEDQLLEQAMCIIKKLPTAIEELQSQNQLHGQLLQIQRLFTAHIDNAVGSPSSEQVQNVCTHMCVIHWIGSEENKCPLTRAVFIDATTKIITWLQSDRTKLNVSSLAEEMCKMVKCYLENRQPHQVTMPVLIESMVNASLSLEKTKLLKNLKFILNSESPDIILSAQKFLLQKEDQIDFKILVPLVPILLELLNSKWEHTSLLENTLKLLIEISVSCGHQLDVNWTFWWDCLLELANGRYGVSVSCAALPVLSIGLKAIVCEGSKWRCVLQAFCNLLVLNSESTMSETRRLAVASSLKIVGTDLLKRFQIEKKEEDIAHTISVFTATLNLLQDEQTEVRCQTTGFVSNLSEEITDKELIVVQPSYALQVVLKYFCQNFKWSGVLLSNLCQQLSVSPELEGPQTIGTLNLFEQEDANIYQEPAKLATYLHREFLIVMTKLRDENTEALRHWIKDHLSGSTDQLHLLHKQLNNRISLSRSFFGFSGMSKPYCVILQTLLQVHLLMSANRLLSPGTAFDMTELHQAASELAKIPDFHPFLQDKLGDIMNLIPQV